MSGSLFSTDKRALSFLHQYGLWNSQSGNLSCLLKWKWKRICVITLSIFRKRIKAVFEIKEMKWHCKSTKKQLFVRLSAHFFARSSQECYQCCLHYPRRMSHTQPTTSLVLEQLTWSLMFDLFQISQLRHLNKVHGKCCIITLFKWKTWL